MSQDADKTDYSTNGLAGGNGSYMLSIKMLYKQRSAYAYAF